MDLPDIPDPELEFDTSPITTAEAQTVLDGRCIHCGGPTIDSQMLDVMEGRWAERFCQQCVVTWFLEFDEANGEWTGVEVREQPLAELA